MLADENPVSLMIERDGTSYVLCTLQHGKHFQQVLDLEFASGEELTFFIRGKGLHPFMLSTCLYIILSLYNVYAFSYEFNFVMHLCQQVT